MTTLSSVQSATLLSLLLLSACERSVAPPYEKSEAFPAGRATVGLLPFPSSELPAANLPLEKKPKFHAGKALAHQPWVKAPTITTARDGLGPLYNVRSCLGCHIRGGRGHIPEGSQPLRSSFLRLSIPGKNSKDGATPEPTYGLQLQAQSIALSHQLRGKVPIPNGESLPPEARVFVRWTEHSYNYPDGVQLSLRKPTVELQELGYGKMHPETMMSLRVAPPIHGAGLVELIAQSDISKLQDQDDKNKDGISGRLNLVWDPVSKRAVPGRFGYKANRANLLVTVAGAFAGDIGITNSVFPTQPCTEEQTECRTRPSGNDEDGVELSDELLALVVDFNRNIGVVARRNPRGKEVLQGRELFYKLGCQSCHHPSFMTQPSSEYAHLGQQRIWPYSDFLLHDMGSGLADGRPDYEASGSEWRTPPLWGLGVSAQVSGAESYLHDGRARSIEEAVLWHGGEAASARDGFSKLSKAERKLLLKFLHSL